MMQCVNINIDDLKEIMATIGSEDEKEYVPLLFY